MYIMEGMMKKQTCNVTAARTKTSTSSAAAALGHVHKGHNSQTISKVMKPKIRIIHIFAPEIIKTDVANFRELVQRLTGKPPTQIKKTPNINTKVIMDKKMEITSHHCSEMIIKEKIKGEEEEEIWSCANSGGGFLGGFAELEGFMEQLNESAPVFPPYMDAFGQPQQIA